MDLPLESDAYRLHLPEKQTLPVVLSSPHSGNRYPQSFVEKSRLDPHSLRRSEDSFVDELFLETANRGVPLLCAQFPRAYVDVNREPFELDPQMFEDDLPSYVNTTSPRVAVGLGTIARNVTSDTPIYNSKLTFAEAKERIERCYWPYHQALRQLVDSTKRQFGFCILIDCHSMPHLKGVPLRNRQVRGSVDFVLGDRFGRSCAQAITRSSESALQEAGYQVLCNTPYPGGFITQHYGEPALGIHCLQIEISRHLYMDEERIERSASFQTLAEQLETLIARLGSLSHDDLNSH